MFHYKVKKMIKQLNIIIIELYNLCIKQSYQQFNCRFQNKQREILLKHLPKQQESFFFNHYDHFSIYFANINIQKKLKTQPIFVKVMKKNRFILLMNHIFRWSFC